MNIYASAASDKISVIYNIVLEIYVRKTLIDATMILLTIPVDVASKQPIVNKLFYFVQVFVIF